MLFKSANSSVGLIQKRKKNTKFQQLAGNQDMQRNKDQNFT